MKKQEVPSQPALFELPVQGEITPVDTFALDAMAGITTNRHDALLSEEDQREDAVELAGKLGWSIDSAMRMLGYEPHDRKSATVPQKKAKKPHRGYRSKVPDNDSFHDPYWNTSSEPLSADQQVINARGADMVRQIPQRVALAKETAEKERIQREIHERDVRVAESWRQVEQSAAADDQETLF